VVSVRRLVVRRLVGRIQDLEQLSGLGMGEPVPVARLIIRAEDVVERVQEVERLLCGLLVVVLEEERGHLHRKKVQRRAAARVGCRRADSVRFLPSQSTAQTSQTFSKPHEHRGQSLGDKRASRLALGFLRGPAGSLPLASGPPPATLQGKRPTQSSLLSSYMAPGSSKGHEPRAEELGGQAFPVRTRPPSLLEASHALRCLQRPSKAQKCDEQEEDMMWHGGSDRGQMQETSLARY
jgi:hypothetical protein